MKSLLWLGLGLGGAGAEPDKVVNGAMGYCGGKDIDHAEYAYQHRDHVVRDNAGVDKPYIDTSNANDYSSQPIQIVQVTFEHGARLPMYELMQ
jgi:hypothetical protein